MPINLDCPKGWGAIFAASGAALVVCVLAFSSQAGLAVAVSLLYPLVLVFFPVHTFLNPVVHVPMIFVVNLFVLGAVWRVLHRVLPFYRDLPAGMAIGYALLATFTGIPALAFACFVTWGTLGS